MYHKGSIYPTFAFTCLANYHSICTQTHEFIHTYSARKLFQKRHFLSVLNLKLYMNLDFLKGKQTLGISNIKNFNISLCKHQRNSTGSSYEPHALPRGFRGGALFVSGGGNRDPSGTPTKEVLSLILCPPYPHFFLCTFGSSLHFLFFPQLY